MAPQAVGHFDTRTTQGLLNTVGCSTLLLSSKLTKRATSSGLQGEEVWQARTLGFCAVTHDGM